MASLHGACFERNYVNYEEVVLQYMLLKPAARFKAKLKVVSTVESQRPGSLGSQRESSGSAGMEPENEKCSRLSK